MLSIREELIFNLEIYQVEDPHAPNIYIMHKLYVASSFFHFRKMDETPSIRILQRMGRNTCVTMHMKQSNQNQILYALLFCYVAKRA